MTTCTRIAVPQPVPHAVRVTVTQQSCIEALAAGWINPPDLCATCTQAFMAALDWVAEPVTLKWHPNFRERAVGSREEVTTQ